MPLSVEKHLAAAQNFLTRVRTLSTYQDLEEKQRNGLLRALAKVQILSASVAAGLLETLQEDLWTETSLRLFREGVASKTAPAEEEKLGSRSQQDYVRLPYFLTDKLIAELFNPQAVDSNKLLEQLCIHAGKLGLRCPSEKTSAVLVAMAHWPQVQKGMTEAQEYDLLHQCKKRIKKHLASVPDSGCAALCLPASVEDLPPAVTSNIFPDGIKKPRQGLGLSCLEGGMCMVLQRDSQSCGSFQGKGFSGKQPARWNSSD